MFVYIRPVDRLSVRLSDSASDSLPQQCTIRLALDSGKTRLVSSVDPLGLYEP